MYCIPYYIHYFSTRAKKPISGRTLHGDDFFTYICTMSRMYILANIKKIKKLERARTHFWLEALPYPRQFLSANYNLEGKRSGKREGKRRGMGGEGD